MINDGKKIFISYSHADEEIIEKIYEELSKVTKPENIFFDRETNRVGDVYWKNIEIAIKGCTHFIYFNSINYDKSSACSRELLLVLGNENAKIIPILLDDLETHPALKKILYYKSNNYLDISKELLKAIRSNDYSGFSRPPLFSNITYYHNNENDILTINFTSNINCSEFKIIHNIDAKVSISATESGISMINKATATWNGLSYQVEIVKTQGSKLFVGENYWIKIDDFSKSYEKGILAFEEADKSQKENRQHTFILK